MQVIPKNLQSLSCRLKTNYFRKRSLIFNKITLSVFSLLLALKIYAGNTEPSIDVYNGGRGSSFNANWKFHLGDVSGANNPTFNDAAWTVLNLPHDWSISLSFDENSPGESGGGYLDGGIGWYRKTFNLPQEYSGQRVTIQFEGIYMNSNVWINGHNLGTRPYGYSSFEYDLTPYLNFGNTVNVIAIEVNNNQPNSRWYSGSGIYRNVWLTVTDPVHVAYCGSFITLPKVSTSSATVSGSTRVQNNSSVAQLVSLVSIISDNNGNIVASVNVPAVNIPANGENTFNYQMNVAQPILWSIDNPYLYTVKTQVYANNMNVDNFVSTLGIRYYSVNANTGFSLNGTPIKLHGVCMHHDLGSLGSAQNYRALERQVEILKSFGCNAIRTSHNPHAPQLMEICDRLGLVVMDEVFDCWKTGKTANDYHLYFNTWAKQDVQDWIRRDRNHPSVVMWSIGNEVPEQNSTSGIPIADTLISWVHNDDATRPITQALNNQTYLGSLLNIVGYNYASGSLYDNDHKNHSNWVIMGSETSSAVRTRGVYHLPADQNILASPDMQCSSYDNSVVSWGNSAEDSWNFDQTRPFVVGQFIWTGFDYIGEPTPYGWPAKSSYFGIVDMSGFPKDIYYFYQSQWTSKSMVHLLPDWNNWSTGDTIPVWAYSNCDSVSLFFNGISLGAKQLQTQEPYHVEWLVPYETGKLQAYAFKNGVVVAEDSVKTAGLPSQIRLKVDRDTILANGHDLSFIETDILDTANVLVPDASNLVNFSISGPGQIVGVDNGNPISLEPFKANYRKAFNGKCLVIVQSTGTEGEIVVTATSDSSIKQSSAIINTIKPTCENEPANITPYIQVNQEGWQHIDSVTAIISDTVTFSPQSFDSISCIWTGPNGYSSTDISIQLSDLQLNQSGTYSVQYNNSLGCSGSKNFKLTVNKASGIKNTVEGNINIYPDPVSANGQLIIEFPDNLTQRDYSIGFYDMYGIEKYQIKTNGGNNETLKMPEIGLSKGLYLIIIKDNQTEVIKKLIIY
jgi:beta-galactosidase